MATTYDIIYCHTKLANLELFSSYNKLLTIFLLTIDVLLGDHHTHFLRGHIHHVSYTFTFKRIYQRFDTPDTI